MRPIWVHCRQSDHCGFTLLELLVVLAIVSALVALVGPGLGSAASRASYRSAEEALTTALQALPQEASRQGAVLKVGAPELVSRIADWPAAFRLELSTVIEYGPTGQAGGGLVTLRMPDGREQRWKVEPVTGRPTRLP
jgi:prepilin-type N-terminal cleavage/methylation domain-containing protein